MKLAILAAFLASCATDGAPGHHRVGTDIHFPPQPGGTISSAAPLSGNGSAASPLAISIADQTVLGNVSGGVGPAIGLSKAQELTRLGITPYNAVLQSLFIRAQSLVGTTINVPQGTEFATNPAVGADWTSNLLNGATAVLSTTLASGVVQLKSNTTTNGQGTISITGTSSPEAQVSDFKSSRWYVYIRAKMATAVDSASQLDLMELRAVTGNSLLWIGQAGGLSTTNMRVRMLDGAGSTITNATITQVVDTNWHDVEAWNDGTNITVDIDQVQQYQTAITALASGNPMYITFFVNCGTTNTNREIDADRMYVFTASN